MVGFGRAGDEVVHADEVGVGSCCGCENVCANDVSETANACVRNEKTDG